MVSKVGKSCGPSGLSFVDMGAGSRVRFTHHFEALIRDLDGTLVGNHSGEGGWMHGLSDDGGLGHFDSTRCWLSSLGSTRHVKKVIVCDPTVKLRTFRWRHVQPQTTFQSRAAVVSTPHGSSLVPHYRYDFIMRTSNRVLAPFLHPCAPLVTTPCLSPCPSPLQAHTPFGKLNACTPPFRRPFDSQPG